jgi:dipeptidyl aminopeptidase/acylaminoacyl peptidase
MKQSSALSRTRGTLFLLSFAFVAAVANAFAAGPTRTLKPEDFAALRDVDEPNISPDGNLVAYVVKAADAEKDKLPGNLWLAKWDGSENRALTFGSKGQSHPRWSPDGKWIAFLSGREDENEIDQLWIFSSSGGEAEKFTDLKGGVEDFAWSPDSKRIVLVVHDPDPREPEKKEKREEDRSAAGDRSVLL